MKINQKFRFSVLTICLGYMVLLAMITEDFPLWVKICCWVLTFGYTAFLLVIAWRSLARPLRRFSAFASKLTDRAEVPAMRWKVAGTAEEVVRLYHALNLLRDKGKGLDRKLKQCYARELELKRSAERQGNLKTQLLVFYLADMNQPLSLLKGATELMESGEAPDAAQMAGIFQRNLQRMSLMIQRMQEIGSLTGDKDSEANKFEIFPLHDLMQELFESNRFFFHERGLVLVNQIFGKSPQNLYSNRELLEQLLMIMIRSVGRCSGAGEKISCGCMENEDRQVIFVIRDNKLGANLFDLAANYEDPEVNNFSLLGLQLVGEQARAIGGRLEVKKTESANCQLELIFDASILPVDNPERNRRASSRTVSVGGGKKSVADGSIDIHLSSSNADQNLIFGKLLEQYGHRQVPMDSAQLLVLGLPLPAQLDIPDNIKMVVILGDNLPTIQLKQFENVPFRQLSLRKSYGEIVKALPEIMKDAAQK